MNDLSLKERGTMNCIPACLTDRHEILAETNKGLVEFPVEQAHYSQVVNLQLGINLFHCCG